MRWRLVDLAQWAHEELGVSVSRQTLGRELRAMGYAKMTARPQHYAQDEDAIDAFRGREGSLIQSHILYMRLLVVVVVAVVVVVVWLLLLLLLFALC